MRMLAWCGTNRSTSSTAVSASESTFWHESTTVRVANLNTSLPLMCMACSWSRTVSKVAGMRLPPAGTRRLGAPLPSLPRSKLKMLPLSVGCTSTAPAPSPKSMQVPRSSQSTILLRTSAPMTRTFVVDAGRDERGGDGEGVDEPGAAGLHVEGAGLGGADLVGDHGRRGRHDVVGRDGGDDDEVELGGVEAARSRQRRAATSPRSLAASSTRAMRRSRMPVRVVIHSSEVSRNWPSSSLVSTRSGTWTPSALMRAPRTRPRRRPITAWPLPRRRRRRRRWRT